MEVYVNPGANKLHRNFVFRAMKMALPKLVKMGLVADRGLDMAARLQDIANEIHEVPCDVLVFLGYCDLEIKLRLVFAIAIGD